MKSGFPVRPRPDRESKQPPASLGLSYFRERGFRVESLARIADMDCETGEITFA